MFSSRHSRHITSIHRAHVDCIQSSKLASIINHRAARGIGFDSTKSVNFLTFMDVFQYDLLDLRVSLDSSHFIVLWMFSPVIKLPFSYNCQQTDRCVYIYDTFNNFNKLLYSLWNHRVIRGIWLDFTESLDSHWDHRVFRLNSTESFNSLWNLRASRGMYFWLPEKQM